MARVNVSDAVWIEFRAACLVEGEHVADALGRLVKCEVRRLVRQSTGASSKSRASTSTTPTLFDEHEEQGA